MAPGVGAMIEGGDIVSLQWTVNVEPLPFGSRRLMIRGEEGVPRPDVTFQATDDGGLVSYVVVW